MIDLGYIFRAALDGPRTMVIPIVPESKEPMMSRASFVGKALVGITIVGVGVWATAVTANAQPLGGSLVQAEVIVERTVQPVAISGPHLDGTYAAVDQQAAPDQAVVVDLDGAGDAAPATSSGADVVPFDRSLAAEFAAAVPVEPTFTAADGRTVAVTELSELTIEQQNALLSTLESGHGAGTTTPAP